MSTATPFILIDPTLRQELVRAPMTFAYFEAPGDVCFDSLCRVRRDPITGRPTDKRSVCEFLAPYVTNVTGIVDRKGTVPPWPAAETAPELVSAEDLGARRILLSCLPWNILLDLDVVIARTWREGLESGKG